MKPQTINFVWGVLLIAAGGLFLAQNLGLVGELSPQIWMVIFTGLSLLFFASYFLSGVQQWGWLFPACIFGGVALVLGLVQAGVDSPLLGAPILLAVGVPFVVAFILDRQEHWWALIPAWIMTVLTLVLVVVDNVPGEVIGSLFMFGVALPFLVVYLWDRSRRWALIPAFVIGATGVIPLLTLRFEGQILGAFITFAIALPFFVVYLWTPRNWWALIPAGILASSGLVVLLAREDGGRGQTAVMNGVMNLGLAATFGVLWLRRATQPTDWAKYPAAGLLVLAIASFIFGTGADLLWPAALIALGVWLLYRNLRPARASTVPAAAPEGKPEPQAAGGGQTPPPAAPEEKPE